MDTLLSTSHKSASFLNRQPDRIIPHGTDTRIYHPAPDRAAAWAEGGLPGRRGIGIFGRVRPNKGHREFVDALCEVLPAYPDYSAVIVGETTPKFEPFAAALKGRIAERGLTGRFVWLGKLPTSEVPVWFRRMSLVAAVPHSEGFGLTCLEALSSGVPVVATRTGAFEMIVRDGIDGRIVPCGNTEALAGVFGELLEQGDKLEVMGRSARERIETSFTVEREAATLIEVYRKALRPAGNRDGS